MDLPDGVTTDHVTRLSALGLQFTEHLPATLPHPDLRKGPTLYLSANMGVAGAVYATDKTESKWHLDPLYRAQLESYIVEALGQKALRALPYYFTVEHYLTVFEACASKLEIMGIPGDYMGDIWAVHSILLMKPIRRPRHMKHIGRALQQLRAIDVPPRMFYESLYMVNRDMEQRPKILERATEASVFRMEHPDVHVSLVRELFA